MAYDTLPALKVVNYYGGAEPKVYTYAQMYFLKDSLSLRLTVFEREPKEPGGAAFAIGGGGESFLLLQMRPSKTELFLCPKAPPPDLWSKSPGKALLAPEAARVQDDDEQGWYWGIQAVLPKEVLQMVGVGPDAEAMRCAVLRYSADSGFGTSYMPKSTEAPLEFSCFNPVSGI